MATATQEQPASRIEVLAKPKSVPPEFSEDRRSVYWVDYVPPRPGPNGTTDVTASPRVHELARHRPPHMHWKGDRPLPVPVSKQALLAKDSERIHTLSLPIHLSSLYKFDRRLPIPVSPDALKAQSSSVIEHLARPRFTQERELRRRNTFFISLSKLPLISEDTKFYQPASKRLLALAVPRREPPEWVNPMEESNPFRVKTDALKAALTQRLKDISRPRSRYLIRDDFDPYEISETALKAKCTPRLKELCEPIEYKKKSKKINKKPKKKPFRLITPIWPVSEQAKNAPTTERILALSRHKTFYEHKLERSPYMFVSESAKRATPSQRLEQLAVPKQRQDRFGVYETEWGQYNPVPETALKATHTERLETLAQSKGYHRDFKDERSIQWTVGNSALNAIATLRLQQLSRPRSRTMIKDDYDPYKISPSAKRARCTPRIDELCVPLPRKVRTKKIV